MDTVGDVYVSDKNRVLKLPAGKALGRRGWDHLVVDEDDPEKRIADLERQLAEHKRGADPGHG